MSLICETCGHRNSDEAEFCAGCGAYLAWERRRPEDIRLPEPAQEPEPRQHAELDVDLPARLVFVMPGERVSVALTVRNRGTRVERVGFEVSGQAAPYARTEPAEAVIPPGDTATCVITFAPGRSSEVPAGPARFTVSAHSSVNSGVSAEAEGRLEIGGFDDLVVEIAPRLSRGRWATKHLLMLINRGNRPREVSLTVTAAEDGLNFTLPTTRLDVPPGRTTLPLRITAQPPLTGAPHEIPFEVVAEPRDGVPAQETRGTRVILPVLAFSAWKALAGVVAVLAVAALAVALLRDRGQPPPGATYTAGHGVLDDGVASVRLPRLGADARIFLTPELPGVAPEQDLEAGQAHTRHLQPVAPVGVTGRNERGFTVRPIGGNGVQGMSFGYLVVHRPTGRIGELTYEAGSAVLGEGTGEMEVEAPSAHPGSVVLLTVELDGPADHSLANIRVNDKRDGGFSVATLDRSAAPMDVGFNWLVVDPGGSGEAGVETATAKTASDEPLQIESPLADDDAVVLLTIEAAHPRLARVPLADVCVVGEKRGSFTVEWFSNRISYLPPDFGYLVVPGTGG
ncbi:hypothetical protein ACGF0J_06130 [Nonomuraea sp. NPDC047897]|uniref:hypothetical protein n=1 Tax=Nonomuraea sp. NPDC047897 TaxID=3364346 RepID=UPI003719E79F